MEEVTYLIECLFVWKINYFEALKNRTNVCTNPIFRVWDHW
jgi:hypothetical protein